MVVAHFIVFRKVWKLWWAMKHHLYTCEMIDDTILDLKNNRNKVRIGFLGAKAHDVRASLMPWRDKQADALIKDLENNFGYALPKIYGADIDKVK
jgi:hypothetical protein